MPRLPTLRPIPPHRIGAPRLSGLLAIIFWCACGITAVPLAGLFTLISVLGPQAAWSAIVDSLAAPGGSSQMLRFGLFPQAVLFVWGISFVIMTVRRAVSTLSVAPIGLVIWLLVTAFSQFAIRDLLAPDGLTVGDLASLLPGLLAQGLGVAGFVGYMREGDRPRRYYIG
ncbi:hypothetical protein V5F77_15745 [Xanthobacter sp. DSM 24535]|uniref:hypothetical protein n=1 Tax=Roseixanthobacter psychrophilus TaxID=3119917 RepID=UPI00372680DC